MQEGVAVVGVIGASPDVQLLISRLAERSIPDRCQVMPCGVELPLGSVQLLYDAATRVLYLWHLLPEATSADPTELQALSTADAAFLRLLLLCHAVVWLQQDSSLSTDLASRLAGLQALHRRLVEAKATTASRPRADSSSLILAFPVAEAADKAGPTQDLEGSLQQQVGQLLGPLQAQAAALWRMTPGQEAFCIPSAHAFLSAVLDSSIAALRPPGQQTQQPKGTAASFAYLKQAVGSVISGVLAPQPPAAAREATRSQGPMKQYSPTLEAWLKDCRAVHEAVEQLQEWAQAAVSSMADLQLDASDEEVQKALQALNGSFCPPLQRLSMQHCHRAAHKAKQMYTEAARKVGARFGAPQQERLVGRAVQQYMQLAMGPSTALYRQRLVQACNQQWRRGHARCEAISLTGHTCILPPHSLPDPTGTPKRDCEAPPHSLFPAEPDQNQSDPSQADTQYVSTPRGRPRPSRGSAGSPSSSARSPASSATSISPQQGSVESRRAGKGTEHAGQDLQVCQHSSGVSFLMADAAGQDRVQVEDPFSLEEARPGPARSVPPDKQQAMAWEVLLPDRAHPSASAAQVAAQHAALMTQHGASYGAIWPKQALGPMGWLAFLPGKGGKRSLKGRPGALPGPEAVELQLPVPSRIAMQTAPEAPADKPAEGLLDMDFPPLAAASKREPVRPASAKSPAQDLRGWWQAMLRGLTPVHHSSKALKGTREPSAGALVLGLEYENCQGERFLYHGQEAVQAVYAPPHVIRSCLPLLLTLGSPSRPSSGATARPLSANPRPPLAFSSAKSKGTGGSKGDEAAARPPGPVPLARSAEDASTVPAERLFQLRRVHLTLPPSPLSFESQPTVCCKVGQQAVIFRATFASPLKAGSSVVIALPWVYALSAGMKQDKAAAEALPGGLDSASPTGLIAVPLADLGSAQVIVRTLAYPA